MIKKFLLLTIIFIQTSILATLNAQQGLSLSHSPETPVKQKFTFYKFKNGEKAVKLKQGKSIIVYYYDSLRPNFESITHGKLSSKNDSMLFISGVNGNYSITREVTNGGDISIGKQYFFWYPQDSIVGINFKKISYVETEPSDAYATVGGIVIAATITSALLIAPAVSINYSKRTFNDDRYFNIMYPSMAAFAVVVIVDIFTGNGRKLLVKR